MWFLEKALQVIPARGKSTIDTTAAIGVLRVATTAASAAHTVPSALKGKWVRMLVVGANTQYAISVAGETAPTLVYNQVSVWGTGHAGAGGTLVDSVPEQFLMPANADKVTVISSGTAGFWECFLAGVK
jgi:hypothetical protein